MKTALVTGAARGLGLEWCRQLATQGYTVIVTARTMEKAQQAFESLGSTPELFFPKVLAVSSEEQLRELALWAEEKFGKLDLIVNNAGINPKDYTDKVRMAKTFYLAELDAKEMLEVLHINSLAPLLVVKHFRHLLNRSEKPVVLNISSWLGSVSQLSFGGHYGYVGSKNLLNVFNKSMANELRSENIICVNVNPGWVSTDMGGQKATFTAEQAVSNMLRYVVSEISIRDTGRFLNYDGKDHPW